MKSRLPLFTHYALRITLPRSGYFILISIIVVFVTSCGIPGVGGAPTPHPSTALPNTPTLSATLTPTPVLPLIPDTLTPDVIPVGGTLPPDTPAETCSPLAVLRLDEISAYITQPFIAPNQVHNAEHPDWVRKDDGHHGVDIGYYKVDGKLFTGTPVLAALEGTISAIVRDRPPYGDMLIVETPFEHIPPALVTNQNITNGDSLYTLYAHLQNLPALTIGQPVACGQPIAETGLTGFTGGPHLHFETRWGPPGRAFTSMAYYRADASPEEMTNYETWRMTAVFHLFDPMELLKDEGGRRKDEN